MCYHEYFDISVLEKYSPKETNQRSALLRLTQRLILFLMICCSYSLRSVVNMVSSLQIRPINRFMYLP